VSAFAEALKAAKLIAEPAAESYAVTVARHTLAAQLRNELQIVTLAVDSMTDLVDPAAWEVVDVRGAIDRILQLTDALAGAK
jgi:hypothetical protein